MNKLSTVYETAIDHTKQKIQKDILLFLQTKVEMPTFEDYLRERNHYIEQIWINVWVNEASNQIPRKEKKEYLSLKGYEVEGVDKKIINKLFRNEIKSYQPFAVQEWCESTYANQENKWVEMYRSAREDNQRQLEALALKTKKRNLEIVLSEKMDELIKEHQHFIYLKIRKMVGDRLKHDFDSKIKFRRVDTFAIEKRLVSLGAFLFEDYESVGEFLDELTGNIQKVLDWDGYDYEYELYYDVYGEAIYEELFKIIQPVLMKNKPSLVEEYGEKLVQSNIEEICQNSIDELCMRFLTYIEEESVHDLLQLANIPFEVDTHQKIFIEDIKQKEQRKAEIEAERKRKEEEEARILKDIFELEYNPPQGRNVRYILHIGETNTGKTYNALQKMKRATSGMYLAPLRLLALEVFDLLNYEGTPCSLKTGEEEKINPSANHISCTVEMFHEKDYFDVVVIDEAQMISDKDRGFSWYKAITRVQADEVHIIASNNAREMLVGLLGESEIEILEYKRETPLEIDKKEFKIKNVSKGDALICFSRKRVLETASRLQNSGHSVSMIYGSMPPETRKKQVERFINGETTIMVATDAIGMGLNLPIQRIVFLESHKFDGTSRRLLSSQEVKQIAGRAGRKGIYDVGKVIFAENAKVMKERLLMEDEPIKTFTIAPTNHIFERFQKYYRDLGMFFILWGKFSNPKGTKKASLHEEKELYAMVRGTELEARLSLIDLYGLLHLPFSTREALLIKQWKKTVEAIVEGTELPEPKLKKNTLEELELSYKAIGLHLLFLYRLNKRTEALYWERAREEISDMVHERLKTDVKKMKRHCRKCNKVLSWDHRYQICEACYHEKHFGEFY